MQNIFHVGLSARSFGSSFVRFMGWGPLTGQLSMSQKTPSGEVSATIGAVVEVAMFSSLDDDPFFFSEVIPPQFKRRVCRFPLCSFYQRQDLAPRQPCRFTFFKSLLRSLLLLCLVTLSTPPSPAFFVRALLNHGDQSRE